MGLRAGARHAHETNAVGVERVRRFFLGAGLGVVDQQIPFFAVGRTFDLVSIGRRFDFPNRAGSR